MNLQDLFSVANLTAAVNKLPAIPGKVGAMGLFDEKGVTSTNVVIDEREGRLVLVPNTSRNDDPAPLKGSSRKRRTFETLHLPINRPLGSSPAEFYFYFPRQLSNTELFQRRVCGWRLTLEATV
jgi:hypothetical protein